MYPTIYHALHDLLGLVLPVLKLLNTFGFFVALAFLGAALCLASELERKHRLGLLASTRRPYVPPQPMRVTDLVVSGLIAFVVGYQTYRDFYRNFVKYERASPRQARRRLADPQAPAPGTIPRPVEEEAR